MTYQCNNYARKSDATIKKKIIEPGDEKGARNDGKYKNMNNENKRKQKQRNENQVPGGLSPTEHLQFRRLPTKHCRKTTSKKINFRK